MTQCNTTEDTKSSATLPLESQPLKLHGYTVHQQYPTL